MAEPRHGPEPGGRQAGSESGLEASSAETVGEPDSPAALQTEIVDLKDRLLRALAEQENIRRHMRGQRDEAVKFAASQLTGDLLETLDNLRRAIESVPPEESENETVKPLLKGVKATQDSLLATLWRHGLERIDPLGAPFDPHRHHAVFKRPDATAAEGAVIEVLQPGYLLHGRMLRPAMVGVAASGKPGDGP